MRRFQFRLERFLDLRRWKEREWEIALAKILGECLLLENRITEIGEEIGSSRELVEPYPGRNYARLGQAPVKIHVPDFGRVVLTELLDGRHLVFLVFVDHGDIVSVHGGTLCVALRRHVDDEQDIRALQVLDRHTAIDGQQDRPLLISIRPEAEVLCLRIGRRA